MIVSLNLLDNNKCNHCVMGHMKSFIFFTLVSAGHIFDFCVCGGSYFFVFGEKSYNHLCFLNIVIGCFLFFCFWLMVRRIFSTTLQQVCSHQQKCSHSFFACNDPKRDWQFYAWKSEFFLKFPSVHIPCSILILKVKKWKYQCNPYPCFAAKES